MKNALFALGVFLIVAGSASRSAAQIQPNAFDLEYTYSSPSEGDFEHELTIHEGKAGMLITLSDRKKDQFGFAFGGAFQIDVWDPDNDRIEKAELYKVKAPVLLDFELTDNLAVFLNATPGIHSDFEEVDDDDFRMEGSGLFYYTMNKSLHFALGASFGEEFGDPQAYPIGGFKWQLTDRLLLDLIFPKPRVQWALFDSFRLFAFGEPSGGEWNVGDNVDTQMDIQQKGFRAGAGAEVGFGERTWFYVAGGIEGARELQLAVNDNEVFDDEVDLDDQAFFRVGIKVTR